MDNRIIDIIVDKVSLDWKRFARGCYTDFVLVDAIIGYIKNDENKLKIRDKKSKMRCLLTKLYEHYPNDYKTKIKSSLKNLNRNDVLQDLSNLDISEKCAALKKYYLVNYGKINELHPPLKSHSNVDLIQKFVDLSIVDAADYEKDTAFQIERMPFLKKQRSYTTIPFSEIFIKENPVTLISGIAGIGKTWLLRKCLLDWSNNLIWINVDLLFYFECRRLNQHQNISNLNELINVFYKDIINDLDINNHKVIFIIDGLDEFKYLNELINPSLSCNYGNYPIVNALVEIQKYKYVLAGRIHAIDQYQNRSTEQHDKLTVQIMGFNESGINYYLENNVIEEKKDAVKAVFKESQIAKSMASVPFYLSCMCKIIVEYKQRDFSFLTMTDLYASIFLYLLQNHIIKNFGLVYQMMENDSNKKYILNVCKIAYELFIENKFIFSREEILHFISGFNEEEEVFFGLIERIETHLGYHYQFAHLTIMEFCASVYAYNNFSGKEIIANPKLINCLSMICGLTNKSQNNLHKFLVNLNNSNDEKISMIHICYFLRDLPDHQNKDSNFLPGFLLAIPSNYENYFFKKVYNSNNSSYDNLFVECFYESQSSFTDKVKSFIDKRHSSINKKHRGWNIFIDDSKTCYATSCELYFVDHLVSSGRKLKSLSVFKSILSNEEKKILMKCSANVQDVYFHNLIEFGEWKPKDKIELLFIDISKYLITKKDFKENFLPWINLCEELYISLHENIDFIDDLYKWIHCLNIKISVVIKKKKF